MHPFNKYLLSTYYLTGGIWEAETYWWRQIISPLTWSIFLVGKEKQSKLKNQKNLGLLWWSSGKDSTLSLQETWEWQRTPVLWARESHEQRSLAGYSPWGRESQTQLKQWSTYAHNLPHWHQLVSSCSEEQLSVNAKAIYSNHHSPAYGPTPPGVGQALNSDLVCNALGFP